MPSPQAAGLDAYRRGAYAEAAADWRIGAAQHDPQSAMFLGVLYDAGRGVTRDPRAALTWYRQAAAGGSAAAMFNIGVLYDAGTGVEVDRPQAVHWYSLASQAGVGRASYALGLIFQDGDGVPRDRALAVHYFALAARQGIGAARAHLTPESRGEATRVPFTPSTLPGPSQPAEDVSPRLHRPLRPPVLAQAPQPAAIPEDPDTVLPPSALAAPVAVALAKDDGAADFRMAGRNLVSSAPERRREAVTHLVAAARKRYPLAEYDLGYCYDTGLDAPHDPPRAYAWYLRALVDTDSPALRNVAQTGAERLRPVISDADAARALSGELTR